MAYYVNPHEKPLTTEPQVKYTITWTGGWSKNTPQPEKKKKDDCSKRIDLRLEYMFITHDPEDPLETGYLIRALNKMTDMGLLDVVYISSTYKNAVVLKSDLAKNPELKVFAELKDEDNTVSLLVELYASLFKSQDLKELVNLARIFSEFSETSPTQVELGWSSLIPLDEWRQIAGEDKDMLVLFPPHTPVIMYLYRDRVVVYPSVEFDTGELVETVFDLLRELCFNPVFPGDSDA